MLAIIGYLVIGIMMYLILKGKVLPAICFAVLPVLGAFIAGFNLTEVLGFIDKGLGTTWKTAVLFIFSVIYFGIMNDAGLFDKMVAALIKHAGNRLPLIMLATVIIATIGHLDGAAASTYLITIPVMLPIFKRMQLRPTVMLLLVAMATGVMNIVPWGGPLIRAAIAIKGDAQAMWHQLIPLQVVGMACGLLLALYFARVEKRRLVALGVNLQAISATVESEVETEERTSTLKRPKLAPVNLVLTLLLIGGLIQGSIPAFILFMFGMVLAAAINYPSLKQQNDRVIAHAPNCIGLVVTLLCAGVFLGIFSNSGIIAAMAKVLIDLLPGFMLRYLHIIVGILGAPIGMIMGPDPYYYAVLPLVGEVVAPLGISMQSVANAMLIGENVGLACSPCVPTTFLALGLSGIELKEHIRFSFSWLWAISIVMVFFGIAIGVIGI